VNCTCVNRCRRVAVLFHGSGPIKDQPLGDLDGKLGNSALPYTDQCEVGHVQAQSVRGAHAYLQGYQQLQKSLWFRCNKHKDMD